MNKKGIFAALMLAAAGLVSCQDDVSDIGASLTTGEVTITVDSLEMSLESKSVIDTRFDGRNLTKLLGRIRVPEYGSLDCSFVSQLLSAESMNIPDSITENEVDSMRLVFSVPRGALTGDTLAPQQLKVYRLDRQLPSDINASFDPTGYYSRSGLLGTRSYTLSVIAKGDSAVKRDQFVRIPVMMPKDLTLDLFRKYRANDPIFEWPWTFNSWFPGIYVEQNFGNGCVANISKAEMYTYWHYTKSVQVLQPDSTYAYEQRIMRDSVCLLASQPEVLSSNIIRYDISDHIKGLVEEGKSIITSPGGYILNLRFPVEHLLDKYLEKDNRVSVVSSLKMDLPATAVKNDFGLGVAPYLLMVKESEREAFFANNKVPDGESSFYAAYDSESGCYKFSSLRLYFKQLLEKKLAGEQLTEEDLDFSLVPVNIETEVVKSYNNTTTVYVTKVQPYLIKPTMTQLYTDRAVICFIYSSQE